MCVCFCIIQNWIAVSESGHVRGRTAEKGRAGKGGALSDSLPKENLFIQRSTNGSLSLSLSLTPSYLLRSLGHREN